ncbi:serine carboxypeptidase domain-containing protein [Phthorimaea operculella]|nr:serine carboxypeptidase domain-containing protein [Phthorimaea operculella]
MFQRCEFRLFPIPALLKYPEYLIPVILKLTKKRHHRLLAIGNGFIDHLTLQRYSYFIREAGLVHDKVASSSPASRTNSCSVDIVQQNYWRYSAGCGPLSVARNGKGFDILASITLQMYYNYLLTLFIQESQLNNLYNYLDDDISLDGAYMDYIQRDEVRRALHVGNTNFTSIGVVYRKLVPDFMGTAKHWLEELLENYRVMLYNGHLDIIVAYHPSVNTYDALTFSGASDFKKAKRKVWTHDGNLAGYYKVAGNLTEVMIRGAGHMVPADKPAASLGLISAFARGIPLEDDTGSLVDVGRDAPRRRRLPIK